MRYIGDIHGRWKAYASLLKDCEASIQVGDFGWGFVDHNTYIHNPDDPRTPPVRRLEEAMSHGNHKYIRGNHDNPKECAKHDFCISDGTILGNTLYIGGAYSIDRAVRLEDYDWWPDEELSYIELGTLIDTYERTKPEIMVTHDCPESIARAIFSFYNDPTCNSKTRLALDSMFGIHPPKLWIFGHWHQPRDFYANGTRFICLPELAYIDIDEKDLSTGKIVDFDYMKFYK